MPSAVIVGCVGGTMSVGGDDAMASSSASRAASAPLPRLAAFLVVTSRAASAVVMRKGTLTDANTRRSASSRRCPTTLIAGSASKSSAGPARSRPVMTIVREPWPSTGVRIVSMRPFNCGAPSMDSTTESPTFTERRSTSHVVCRSREYHSAKVNGDPGVSMSSVMAYSSHTSSSTPDDASVSLTSWSVV